MCSGAVAKILLFTFNFLFFTCGVLLLAFGITGVANEDALVRFLSRIPGVDNMAGIINIPNTVASGSIYMIILGSFLFLYGFFGCVGVLCASKWMLFIYWISLCALVAAEIGLIIYAAVAPGKMEANIQKMMYNSLKNKFQPVYIHVDTGDITLPDDVVATSWVAMQFEVGCCGAYGYSDYMNFTWNSTVYGIDAVVPPSCCVLTNKGQVPQNIKAIVDINSCLTLKGSYNDEGCYKAVVQLVQEYSYIAIGICSAVIAFEIICIMCAIYLWRLRDEKRPV